MAVEGEPVPPLTPFVKAAEVVISYVRVLNKARKLVRLRFLLRRITERWFQQRLAGGESLETFRLTLISFNSATTRQYAVIPMIWFATRVHYTVRQIPKTGRTIIRAARGIDIVHLKHKWGQEVEDQPPSRGSSHYSAFSTVRICLVWKNQMKPQGVAQIHRSTR